MHKSQKEKTMALTNKEQRMIFESAAVAWSGNVPEKTDPAPDNDKQLEEQIFMDFVANLQENSINENISDEEFDKKVWDSVINLNTLTDIVNRVYFGDR